MPGLLRMSADKWLIALAVLIEALWLALITWGQYGQRVVESIFLLLLMGALFPAALYLVLHARTRPGIFIIISASLCFRLTAFFCPSPFSGDIYRYRYEGKAQAAGANPYEVAPDDPAWSHLRDEMHERIPSRHARAGYGPVLQLLYGGWYRLNSTVAAWWWKLPAAVFDTAILILLTVRLRDRAIAYAWSPLPVWEFWGNGHNDAIAVFFVVAALFLRERPAWSYAALGMAVAAKLWPILLFPVFLRRIRSWWALAVIPLWAALSLPYWTDITQNIRFTSGFLGGWRNNDSLFGAIAYFFPDPETAKLVALGMAAACAVVIAFTRLPLDKGVLFTIIGLLLFSANCHPWYLTWFAPLLCFFPSAPLLLWTAAMPLAYSVLIDFQLLGEWNGSTPLRWWIYVPVFALVLIPRRILSIRPERNAK